MDYGLSLSLFIEWLLIFTFHTFSDEQVDDISNEPQVERELMLIKVIALPQYRGEVLFFFFLRDSWVCLLRDENTPTDFEMSFCFSFWF